MLEEALVAAIAREDYVDAARLKAEVKEAVARTELARLTKADNHQTHLVGAVDKMIKSTSSGVVVLRNAAPRHCPSSHVLLRSKRWCHRFELLPL
jgi:hypothetical protein